MRIVVPREGVVIGALVKKKREKLVATRRRGSNLWNINPSRSVAVASRQRATQRSGGAIPKKREV